MALMIFVPLIVLAGATSAAPVYSLPLAYVALSPVPENIYNQVQDTKSGEYAFGYAGGPVAREEARTADGVTRGAYSYVDAHGIVQHYRYVADAEGFRVAGTNIPTEETSIHQSLRQPVDVPIVEEPADKSEEITGRKKRSVDESHVPVAVEAVYALPAASLAFTGASVPTATSSQSRVQIHNSLKTVIHTPAEAIPAETVATIPVASVAVSAIPVTARTVEAVPAAAKTFEGLPVAAETIEAIPIAAKTIEAIPAAAETIEAIPAAAKIIEAVSVATETIEAIPVAAKNIEAIPAAARTIEAIPVAAKTIEAIPVAAKTIEAIPAAEKTIEAIPAAAKTMEAIPVAAKTIEAIPVAVKTIETIPAALPVAVAASMPIATSSQSRFQIHKTLKTEISPALAVETFAEVPSAASALAGLIPIETKTIRAVPVAAPIAVAASLPLATSSQSRYQIDNNLKTEIHETLSPIPVAIETFEAAAVHNGVKTIETIPAVPVVAATSVATATSNQRRYQVHKSAKLEFDAQPQHSGYKVLDLRPVIALHPESSVSLPLIARHPVGVGLGIVSSPFVAYNTYGTTLLAEA